MPATGLRRGASSMADPQLASAAVEMALERLGSARARTVLLFLSGHYARNPAPAIHAAARAAQTTQIAGCTAVGVYTE
ncbi:MAG: histidine kinase, partial [Betaproteobacteria bacterium]